MKNFIQKPKPPESRSLKGAPISDYMVTNLITFRPDTEIDTVINTFLEKGITGAPVLNENKEIVGLIDDKDCLSIIVQDAYHNQPGGKATVDVYMTNVMRTISVDADVIDAATIFLRTPYKRLLVIDHNGKLVGQVSRRDILRAIKDMKATTW
ncbi:MAG TPA: CBS domain-containing protein [Saprospiraceae bacterium]|nr:CBS domain-containing protein [Saprospiraceae bacterium]